MNRCVQAAIVLHRHLVARHWDGYALVGPDPGIRLNHRVGRFVKSYLPGVRWNDALYYLQAQGYWVLSNWRLFALTGNDEYRNIAVRCSEQMLVRQRGDGAWEYPNPEWRGRVATVEGIWASLGLLESWRQTADPKYLTGVLKWNAFMVETIGFQRVGDELSVNYFAHRGDGRVPNNSADLLRFLAELVDVTGDQDYFWPRTGLLNFLQRAQKSSGEFPYIVPGMADREHRPHFQCFQYNAFQCLGLMRYHELSNDGRVVPLVKQALRFLATGVTQDGRVLYECGNRYREVIYHTAAVGAALATAKQLGIGGYGDLADRAYSHLLESQQVDGGFPYSRRDYRLLKDHRSYPRYLAMILFHLLIGGAPSVEGKHISKEQASELVHQEGLPRRVDASTDQKMRTLVVTSRLPDSTRPGSMAPVARQIESLRAAGVQVDVLEVRGLPALKYLQSLPRLWSQVRSADLIHAHYGYCGWLARVQPRKPIVVSFMGDDLLGTPNANGRTTYWSRLVVHADRWLARLVDAVIVKSAEMANIVAPVKAFVIPNGVDLKVFHPMDQQEARGQLGLSDDKRYILFPSSPGIPRKGFPLASAAVAAASQTLMEPLELVTLWGIAPDQVPLYMNACDALILTSYLEGSPNVVKEAMACNLPVVSVPVGDVPELLAGVENCAVCPRQADALGSALAQILRTRRRSSGRFALELKGLDQDSVAHEIVCVYQKVLAQRRE